MENHKCEEKRCCGKRILGTVAALLTGAVAGILLAPKAGKEIRKDIKKHAQKIRKEVIEKTGKAKEIAREKYQEVAGVVADSYKKIKAGKKEEGKLE